MRIFGTTDTGITRVNNEDSFYVSLSSIGVFDQLMIVCDGMGGHSYGEVASQTAVDTVVNFFKNAPMDNPIYLIDQAMSLANLNVRKVADEKRSYGMGTTMVLAGIIGDHVYAANVGDSRLYLLNIRKNTMEQISEDHSFVEEQVRRGLLQRNTKEYEAQKHVITRAIGIYAEVLVDHFDFPLFPDSVLLLATDGLTNMVDDIVIKNLALDTTFNLKKRVETLIKKANDNGGKDNITVVLAESEDVTC